MFSRFVYVVACIRTSFCGCFAEECSIVSLCPISFTRLSDDRRLSSSHLEALMNNNVALSLLEYLFLILWGIYLRVESLGHMVMRLLCF